MDEIQQTRAEALAAARRMLPGADILTLMRMTHWILTGEELPDEKSRKVPDPGDVVEAVSELLESVASSGMISLSARQIQSIYDLFGVPLP